jgi:glycosyltransferase involved in cell wall biosynthesis
MFTHPNWTFSFSESHVIWCLNKADKVICLNSKVQRELIAAGLDAKKTSLIHIASDPDFFYKHERKTGDVGFCSAFGERKNPDLVYQLVKNMPERKFHLIGRYWENYERYDEMKNMANFTYYNNKSYDTYPDLYSKIDIFISPSILEGGPVPVLEAMLSNCFPIASKTGFCPDVISDGKNGFLFDIDAEYSEVIKLIKLADSKTIDVRQTALEYSWKNCSQKIDKLFQE